MPKLSHVLLFLFLALVGGPIWYAFTQGYRSETSYTCIRCRAIKHSDTVFWWEVERIEVTAFSRWITEHCAPHEHLWAWCGSIKTCYPLGVERGCGRQHPIWRINPELQVEFTEAAAPDELESFYAQISSPNRAAQSRAVDMVWEKCWQDHE